MSTVSITFARHGESIANIEQSMRRKRGEKEVIGGHNLHTQLTEKGREQATYLGQYLIKEGKHLYCSPLRHKRY